MTTAPQSQPDTMFGFGGYRIFPSMLVARWRYTGPVVARSLPCFSTTAREAFNDWAIALFGGKREGCVIISEIDRTIYAHPQMVRELRAVIGIQP